jgi:DNA topoisomerase-1
MARTNNKKSLVIVESPAKAKTINKYLGPDFEVKASMGHVRDLPSKRLSVDIENDFEPTYEITPNRKKTVVSLKAAAKGCRDLYLATDLDREVRQSPGIWRRFLGCRQKEPTVWFSMP